jgi:hypothetical protein
MQAAFEGRHRKGAITAVFDHPEGLLDVSVFEQTSRSGPWYRGFVLQVPKRKSTNLGPKTTVSPKTQFSREERDELPWTQN